MCSDLRFDVAMLSSEGRMRQILNNFGALAPEDALFQSFSPAWHESAEGGLAAHHPQSANDPQHR